MARPTHPKHMSPAEFREAGAAVLDWICRYWESIESYPVVSQVEPGEIRDRLPPRPPEKGESFPDIMRDVERIILPGITHWQSPNFFGYFPANASGPAVLGDLLSSGLGVQGMLWSTSPACTELETHVLDWLVDLLHLPDKFRSSGAGGGVIQDTASSATLCAMLAARERTTGFATNRQGTGRGLTAYASSQAHSSVEKAAGIAGIGRENLRLVAVDDNYAMLPDALERAVAEDLRRGRTPFFVVATVGTTSSTAVDPLRRIGEVCLRYGLWLHVDAAHAGSAAVCPEFRWIHDGLELADSYCVNPHKWLLTNFDCDCFYVADRETLVRTLSVLPEYLRNPATDSGRVIDYRDWQIPLGRRFRALKLWFVIRYYGAEGLREHIRHCVALAQDFARRIEKDGDFALAAPVPLNLVCFYHRAGNDITRLILERVNSTGKAFLTHTTLHDKFVIRLAVGSPWTRAEHIERVWHLTKEAAGDVRSAAGPDRGGDGDTSIS
ncbi:L-2,4-diaminobutyrate decarboxylase [bacterium HR33]|nr:L-2,4-diaminobutyrate decarboxylase [bacterium HR33]